MELRLDSPEQSGFRRRMASYRFSAAICAAALLLTGCSFTDEALFPSLAGESSGAGDEFPTAQTTAVEGAPAFNTGSFEPEGVTPGAPTGTFVGQKVEELRGDLERLQSSIGSQNQQLQELRGRAVQNANAYHGTVGAISARLQVGTTPGNPVLVQQWNTAQTQLEQVSADLAQMNSLSNDVAANAALSSYLLEATRASFGISGAVDEDHRQLAILEDEVNRTTVLIDRLLSELTEDVARQTNYLGTERSNLTTLALGVSNGELYGTSLGSRAYVAPAAPASAPGAGLASGRPLVVIRFDRPNVQYEQALYEAISTALERRPNAAFDLVAVAPAGGTPAQVALNSNNARRNAESVLRTLTNMGLPAERVSLAATTSPSAQTNEVHLYVR
jgi:hypothetical protein